jgi:amidase
MTAWAFDPFASAIAVAEAIRLRRISVAEVSRRFRSRIERIDPYLRSFVWFDEAFLDRAARADEILAMGGPIPPFFGVPIAIKDVQNVAGQPNSKSSLAVSNEHQEQSDLFIERLLSAGLSPIGRTAASELAAGLMTESIKHGITANPWHPDISPAGSSGGAAAAIAAGLVPAATATDGGGSIRLPAAACGLVGLKPSRGLLPQRTPNWEGSSVDGFITRTTADTAALLDVSASPDLRAWTVTAAPEPAYLAGLHAPPGALRIGLLTAAPNGAEVDDDCVRAVTEVASFLRRDGHEIVAVEPDIGRSPAFELYRSLVAPAGSHLLDYDLSMPMKKSVRRSLGLIEHMSVRDYVRGVAELKRRVRELVEPWFSQFDVLLTPTTSNLTPGHGEVAREMDEPGHGQSTLQGASAFTSWVNILGLPAVSAPTHLDRRRMPIGTQIIGRPFSEVTLLALTQRLEGHYRWMDRYPTWLINDLDRDTDVRERR